MLRIYSQYKQMKMFQITNSSYRLRKKNFLSKNAQIQDGSILGKAQSNKFYMKSYCGNQNHSLNLSTPKNMKILPKLQKTFLFQQYPHRYALTPSEQASISKYPFRQNDESGEGKNTFFRSQKDRIQKKQSDGKLNGESSSQVQIDKNCVAKFLVLNRKGKRPYNQDRYLCKVGIHKFYTKNQGKLQEQKEQQIDFYSVFDGHGGSGCAQFLKNNFLNFLIRTKNLDSNPQQALRQAFRVSQQKFIALCQSRKFATQTSGACAISCIVTQDRVTVGSVGDCRALMFNKEYLCEMTRDHKPTETNEKMRILKSGGKVFKQQIRVNQTKGIKIYTSTRIAPGNLNVSRTIGDIQTKLKKYGGLPGMISPQPDVKTFEKQNYKMLVLASDGLFQAFSNSQIQKFYYKLVQNQQKNKTTSSQLAKKFLDKLMEQAQQKSTDNITIIVVPLISHKFG